MNLINVFGFLFLIIILLALMVGVFLPLLGHFIEYIRKVIRRRK